MSDGSTRIPANRQEGFCPSSPLAGMSGGLTCIVAAVGWVYFGPWLGLWLALLAGLALISPSLGLGILFVCVSIDIPRPVFGHLIVSFSELEVAVFSGAWVAGRTYIQGFPIRDWRLLSWSSPFLASMLLSGLASSSVGRAVPNSLRFAEMFVMALMARNVLGRGQPRGPRLRWFLLGAATLYITLGLFQFTSVRWGRIYSSFENPNQFAGYLALLLPFFTALLLTTSRPERTIWGYTIVVSLLACAATLSRAGFLAGCSGLLIVLATSWVSARRKGIPPRQMRLSVRRLLPHLLILLALLAALSVAPATRNTLQISLYNLAARSQGGLLASFAEARLPYFKVGWGIWQKHFWLGVGPGNYRRAISENRALVQSYRGKLRSYGFFSQAIKLHVHNLYLQTAVNFGILGLVCFLYFLYRLLIWLLERSQYTPAALAGLGMLVAFLLHNTLDVTYPSLGLETGVLIGLASASERL